MKLSKGVLAVVAAMSAGCATGGAVTAAQKPTTVTAPVVAQADPPANQNQPEEEDPAPMTDPDPDYMAACGRG